MIIVDTTVLVYAVGADHTYREPCRQLIGAIKDGSVEATTTAEVIQEFVHVRARRRDRGDAADLGRAFSYLLSPLLVVEERDLAEGFRLFEKFSDVGAFDAVLAAATLGIGADALVSADVGFSRVPQLRHLVPNAHGIVTLLSTQSR